MVIEIRKWTHRDDIEDLTELIHRAYRVLADQGLFYLGTHQESSVTLDRMSDGECWVAVSGGKLVGTVMIYPPAYMSGCPYYKDFGPAVFGQFAVDPEFQGLGVGRRLIERVEEISRDAGATILACDTSEQAMQLIAMYKKWGFDVVGEADWRPKVNYKSVILARPINQIGP